uniref:Uncharacterized protein n=1 Tax=Romanomermis culicivorax TaxID=13658 RepID=A0A915IJN3_ROMCU
MDEDEDDIHIEILDDITSDKEEMVVLEDLEDITSKEEEEEEKTLNNDILDEEGTISDYEADENEQFKTHTPHSSDKEEIYEPVEIGRRV